MPKRLRIIVPGQGHDYISCGDFVSEDNGMTTVRNVRGLNPDLQFSLDGSRILGVKRSGRRGRRQRQ